VAEPAHPGAVGLYLRLVGQSIRAQLQYRVSVLLMAFGSFLALAVELLGMWALFDRFGQIAGWRLPHAMFLFGVVNVAFGLCEALGRGFDIFAREFVRTGAFDRVLLRPRSTVLQLAGHELQLHRIGRLAQGVFALIYAVVLLDLDWTLWRAALLVVAVLGALALFYALFILQATLSFWTVESLELMNILTYGGTETAQYPLPIYSTWLRRLFTYVVPLACVSYFPSVAVFGVEDPLGSTFVQQCLAPLAGFVFLGLALLAWRAGIRHYTSTGS
jgi:ABC-2 type transport system permease protein